MFSHIWIVIFIFLCSIIYNIFGYKNIENFAIGSTFMDKINKAKQEAQEQVDNTKMKVDLLAQEAEDNAKKMEEKSLIAAEERVKAQQIAQKNAIARVKAEAAKSQKKIKQKKIQKDSAPRMRMKMIDHSNENCSCSCGTFFSNGELSTECSCTCVGKQPAERDETPKPTLSQLEQIRKRNTQIRKQKRIRENILKQQNKKKPTTKIGNAVAQQQRSMATSQLEASAGGEIIMPEDVYSKPLSLSTSVCYKLNPGKDENGNPKDVGNAYTGKVTGIRYSPQYFNSPPTQELESTDSNSNIYIATVPDGAPRSINSTTNLVNDITDFYSSVDNIKDTTGCISNKVLNTSCGEQYVSNNKVNINSPICVCVEQSQQPAKISNITYKIEFTDDNNQKQTTNIYQKDVKKKSYFKGYNSSRDFSNNQTGIIKVGTC